MKASTTTLPIIGVIRDAPLIIFIFTFGSLLFFIYYSVFIKTEFPDYNYAENSEYQIYKIAQSPPNFQLRFDFLLSRKEYVGNTFENLFDSNILGGGFRIEIKRSRTSFYWGLCSANQISDAESCVKIDFDLAEDKWVNIRLNKYGDVLLLYVNNIFSARVPTDSDLSQLVFGTGHTDNRVLQGALDNIEFQDMSKKRYLILAYIFFFFLCLYINISCFKGHRNDEWNT